MKRIVVALLAGLLCLFVIWCFGIDMSKRGVVLGITAIVTIFIVGIALTCPYESLDDWNQS